MQVPRDFLKLSKFCNECGFLDNDIVMIYVCRTSPGCCWEFSNIEGQRRPPIQSLGIFITVLGCKDVGRFSPRVVGDSTWAVERGRG